jgi:putative tricarboxylic transport membrane protein
LLLGAMMIHGITPGPLFISEKPEIFWGLIASFWIGNILLLIPNIPLIGIWVRVLRVPYQALYLFIFPLICVGVFSLRNEVFDVVTVLVVGVFGYFLKQFKFEPAPLMISFVLGPMLEENFRRAVLIGRGEISYFFNSTLSSTLLILTLLIALWAIFAPALKRHM